MNTVSLELHDELVCWLKEIAAKRDIELRDAIHQLLEEERMRKLFVKEIEVPIGNCLWKASVPMRGLIYSGYETHWQRVESAAVAAN